MRIRGMDSTSSDFRHNTRDLESSSAGAPAFGTAIGRYSRDSSSRARPGSRCASNRSRSSLRPRGSYHTVPVGLGSVACVACVARPMKASPEPNVSGKPDRVPASTRQNFNSPRLSAYCVKVTEEDLAALRQRRPRRRPSQVSRAIRGSMFPSGQWP